MRNWFVLLILVPMVFAVPFMVQLWIARARGRGADSARRHRRRYEVRDGRYGFASGE